MNLSVKQKQNLRRRQQTAGGQGGGFGGWLGVVGGGWQM